MTDLQLEQRQAALIVANEVRVRKALLRKQIASNDLSILDVLADPPSELAHEAIGRVMCLAPGIGPDKVDRVLGGIVHQHLAVGDISSFARGEIIQRLEFGGKRWRMRPAAFAH